jgi:hypothetical protein
VTPPDLHPASPEAAPSARADAPRNGPGAWAWWQALALSVLAWMALLCAGLGSTAGVVTQTLAGKLPVNAQHHLQRHAGNALASRSARRDHTPALEQRQVAEVGVAVLLNPLDKPRDNPLEAPPAAAGEQRSPVVHAVQAPLPVAAPALAQRWPRAHLSRAPPALA